MMNKVQKFKKKFLEMKKFFFVSQDVHWPNTLYKLRKWTTKKTLLLKNVIQQMQTVVLSILAVQFAGVQFRHWVNREIKL